MTLLIAAGFGLFAFIASLFTTRKKKANGKGYMYAVPLSAGIGFAAFAFVLLIGIVTA